MERITSGIGVARDGKVIPADEGFSRIAAKHGWAWAFRTRKANSSRSALYAVSKAGAKARQLCRADRGDLTRAVIAAAVVPPCHAHPCQMTQPRREKSRRGFHDHNTRYPAQGYRGLIRARARGLAVRATGAPERGRIRAGSKAHRGSALSGLWVWCMVVVLSFFRGWAFVC